ncbi:unnamed protein product [Protopolystoma xenopodis]|uniref:Uncharacterized protein n=1 Tax=Protopolystoma xenopodis TaxID=117903 RepID=A0A448X5D5_9PLAT|nr:unnamed protein product [Protopolystoma xenopodis]
MSDPISYIGSSLSESLKKKENETEEKATTATCIHTFASANSKAPRTFDKIVDPKRLWYESDLSSSEESENSSTKPPLSKKKRISLISSTCILDKLDCNLSKKNGGSTNSQPSAKPKEGHKQSILSNRTCHNTYDSSQDSDGTTTSETGEVSLSSSESDSDDSFNDDTEDEDDNAAEDEDWNHLLNATFFIICYD